MKAERISAGSVKERASGGALASLCLLACLVSCGPFKLSPRSHYQSEYDCFGDSERSEDVLSSMEEGFRRAGALRTKGIRMQSDVGMMDRTARLYILNGKRHVLVFRLMHSIFFVIKDYGYVIKGDSSTIASGSLGIDSKATFGQATEEYLFLELTGKQAGEISTNKSVTIYVGDIPFVLPYGCRETFRRALKVGYGN